jgi:hypothetical protein
MALLNNEGGAEDSFGKGFRGEDDDTAGKPPLGWYTGQFGMNTLKAVVKHGGFLYSSDSYNDDLPYWVRVDGTVRFAHAVPGPCEKWIRVTQNTDNGVAFGLAAARVLEQEHRIYPQAIRWFCDGRLEITPRETVESFTHWLA